MFDANQKQILSRKLARHRKIKEEKSYNKQVEKIQDEQFESYKAKAISQIGGGGQPQVLKNPKYQK